MVSFCVFFKCRPILAVVSLVLSIAMHVIACKACLRNCYLYVLEWDTKVRLSL